MYKRLVCLKMVFSRCFLCFLFSLGEKNDILPWQFFGFPLLRHWLMLQKCVCVCVEMTFGYLKTAWIHHHFTGRPFGGSIPTYPTFRQWLSRSAFIIRKRESCKAPRRAMVPALSDLIQLGTIPWWCTLACSWFYGGLANSRSGHAAVKEVIGSSRCDNLHTFCAILEWN